MSKLRSVYGILWKHFIASKTRHRSISMTTLCAYKSWNHGPIADTLLSSRYYSSEDHNLHRDLAAEFHCNVEEISKGDTEVADKIHNILLEMHYLQMEGELVPSKLAPYQLEDLLLLDTFRKRKRFYLFLGKSQFSRHTAKEMKVSRAETEVFLDIPFHMDYRLCRNNLFLRFYKKTEEASKHMKLFTASQFNPPFVVDCSYAQHMSFVENRSCAKQFSLMLHANKQHQLPLHLVFCNVNKNDMFMKLLNRVVPNLYYPNCPFFYHEGSYLDLFPKERLVYLTPHAKSYVKFNPNDIYIMGAFVDKADGKPVSYVKAQAEGLQMGKLPLDLYVKWKQGNKSLNFVTLTNIMCDMYKFREWDIAFKNLPTKSYRD